VWLPVALGIAVIAIESTPYLGADRTDSPLRWLWQHLFGPVADARWPLIHHLIRKCGHFVGYGLIGLACLRAWWMSLPGSRFLQDALLALAATALVAGADEWHQTFLPNRTGRIQDVFLDCLGALTLETAVYLYLRLRTPQVLARAA
jgi:VanZ family protein